MLVTPESWRLNSKCWTVGSSRWDVDKDKDKTHTRVSLLRESYPGSSSDNLGCRLMSRHGRVLRRQSFALNNARSKHYDEDPRMCIHERQDRGYTDDGHR